MVREKHRRAGRINHSSVVATCELGLLLTLLMLFSSTHICHMLSQCQGTHAHVF